MAKPFCFPHAEVLNEWETRAPQTSVYHLDVLAEQYSDRRVRVLHQSFIKIKNM